METKHDIYKEVCEVVVKQLGVREDQISPCSHIADNLGADTLDCVEIIMALEEQFGICIPDDDSDNLHTVEQITDYVCNRLGIH